MLSCLDSLPPLQAPLFMGFSRLEYRSRLPFTYLGDLPSPGFEPKSPASPALQANYFTAEPPGKVSKTSPQISK